MKSVSFEMKNTRTECSFGLCFCVRFTLNFVKRFGYNVSYAILFLHSDQCFIFVVVKREMFAPHFFSHPLALIFAQIN